MRPTAGTGRGGRQRRRSRARVTCEPPRASRDAADQSMRERSQVSVDTLFGDVWRWQGRPVTRGGVRSFYSNCESFYVILLLSFLGCLKSIPAILVRSLELVEV